MNALEVIFSEPGPIQGGSVDEEVIQSRRIPAESRMMHSNQH